MYQEEKTFTIEGMNASGVLILTGNIYCIPTTSNVISDTSNTGVSKPPPLVSTQEGSRDIQD